MAEPSKNPYTPGASHPPPFLAGRDNECEEFRRLLEQPVILENVVLTGLRGVGKTSLLREFKQEALASNWLWAENDISENVSVSEDNLLARICADLGVLTGDWAVEHHTTQKVGFTTTSENLKIHADAGFWADVAKHTPGLNSDKLKKVLVSAGELMSRHEPDKRGIIFAYDEAQNLGDNATKEQYPLSLLLDVFNSLQRQQIPFMLVLTGLPPLHAQIVTVRTFAERMFHVITLNNLDREASFKAILEPLQKGPERSYFDENKEALYQITSGYPYFIQYWCQKLYDQFIPQRVERSGNIVERIRDLLDDDFFAARWARLSDRERDLLCAATLAVRDGKGEFSIQGVIQHSSVLSKEFSPSHASQTLARLSEKGMVLKTRHGKYMFAVPQLDDYIRRRHTPGEPRA